MATVRCRWCGHCIQSVPHWNRGRPFCNEQHFMAWYSGKTYHGWGNWFLPLYVLMALAVLIWACSHAWGQERQFGHAVVFEGLFCNNLGAAEYIAAQTTDQDIELVLERKHDCIMFKMPVIVRGVAAMRGKWSVYRATITQGILAGFPIFVVTTADLGEKIAYHPENNQLWDDSPYSAQISSARNQRDMVCCDPGDGVQVAEPTMENGHWTFEWQGKKWTVEDWMLVKQPNPTGHAYAWIWNGELRCWWLPAGI